MMQKTLTNRKSSSQPDTPISITGSVVKRNIFFFEKATTAMLAAQTGYTQTQNTQTAHTNKFRNVKRAFLIRVVQQELKPKGSDFNLFFSPSVDAASASIFPGQVSTNM